MRDGEITPKFVLDARAWGVPGKITASYRHARPSPPNDPITMDMPNVEVEAAMSNCLAAWVSACPNLKFSFIGDNLAPHDDATATPPDAGDLRILFGPDDHDGGVAGDPVFGGILGHAWFPPVDGVTQAGDVHFNDDFLWALSGAAGGGEPKDLPTVACHMFGHALGLEDSDSPDCGGAMPPIMCPDYTGPSVIRPDDIDAIRAKYCPGANPPSKLLDIVVLLDVTGSMTDDLPIIQGSMNMLRTSISTFTNGTARIGLATFRDFPFTPWGNAGDYAYRKELDLVPIDESTIADVVGDLTAGGGFDLPESQYEALYQAAAGAGGGGLDLNADGDFTDAGEFAEDIFDWDPMGEPQRKRIIFLITDADFHNNDAPGLENYPCGDGVVTGIGRPADCINQQSRGRDDAIAALQFAGFRGTTVFTMIASNPPDLTPLKVSEMQGGGSVDGEIGIATAKDHGDVLARRTEGGVFLSGQSSQHLAPAVVAALNQATRFLTGPQIPTLSEYGLLALVLFLLTIGLALVRSRSLHRA